MSHRAGKFPRTVTGEKKRLLSLLTVKPVFPSKTSFGEENEIDHVIRTALLCPKIGDI